MPNLPTRICKLCNSRATENGYCERHKSSINDSQHCYDSYRADDPIRALYRGKNLKKWQRVRHQVLKRDILCKMCGHEAATEVDHILSARVIVDNFGIDEFYNVDRLQGLCHDCHNKKTRIETRKLSTILTSKDLSDRSNTTVVCLSKDTDAEFARSYVNTHKQPNDLVFDYDVVMNEVINDSSYTHLQDAIGSVLAKRDEFIRSTNYCDNHVYLIVTNRQSFIVKLLEQSNASVVVV